MLKPTPMAVTAAIGGPAPAPRCVFLEVCSITLPPDNRPGQASRWLRNQVHRLEEGSVIGVSGVTMVLACLLPVLNDLQYQPDLCIDWPLREHLHQDGDPACCVSRVFRTTDDRRGRLNIVPASAMAGVCCSPPAAKVALDPPCPPCHADQ